MNKFNQWFLTELVTPPVISYRALSFSYPHGFRPGLRIGLAGVQLSIDRDNIRGVHYEIITSNIVYNHLIHCFTLK